MAVAPGGEVNVAAASGSSGCGGEAEPRLRGGLSRAN